MDTQFVFETAERLLADFSSPRNPFGSDGELEFSLEMARKWGGESKARSLVSALARVARQRGITNSDEPFVWDAEECTHHIDWQQCRKMCEAL